MKSSRALFAFCFSFLLLCLTACGTNLGSSQTPVTTPAVQLDLNDEFWYGTLSSGSRTIPAGMGFLQEGNAVTGILAFSDSSGNVTTLPRMRGTLSGSTLSLSATDGVGDMGRVQGNFDAAGQTFSGTLTFVIDGATTSYGLSLFYEGPLGTQMQAQRVTSFGEVMKRLE